MGLFGGIGESKTRTTVSTVAPKVTTTADNGGVAVERGAAVFNTSTANNDLNLEEGATQIKAGGNLTINQNADTKFLGDTLDKVLSNRAQSDLTLDKVLASVENLAENKQSDGAVQRDRTILVIVLGLLAAVGLWIWRNSR